MLQWSKSTKAWGINESRNGLAVLKTGNCGREGILEVTAGGGLMRSSSSILCPAMLGLSV